MVKKGRIRVERPTLAEAQVAAGLSPAFLDAGYVLASSFEVVAYLHGEVTVRIDVEISEGRARPRRVCAEAADVTSTTLRDIPIRRIVGIGCASRLLRVRPQKEGIALAPLTEEEEKVDADDVIRRLVGWLGEVER